MNETVTLPKSRFVHAILSAVGLLLFALISRSSLTRGDYGLLILVGTPVLAGGLFFAPMMLHRELSALGAKTAFSRRIPWKKMESVKIVERSRGRRSPSSVEVRLRGGGQKWTASIYARSEAEHVRAALLAWLPAEIDGRDSVSAMCRVFEDQKL